MEAQETSARFSSSAPQPTTSRYRLWHSLTRRQSLCAGGGFLAWLILSLVAWLQPLSPHLDRARTLLEWWQYPWEKNALLRTNFNWSVQEITVHTNTDTVWAVGRLRTWRPPLPAGHLEEDGEPPDQAPPEGLILSSRDGGQSWRPQIVGTNVPLTMVFASARNGFAAGTRASVWQTTNAGVTWAQRRDLPWKGANLTDEAATLRKVRFNRNREGVIAGGNGTLLITKDGGTTWENGAELLPGLVTTNRDIEEFDFVDPVAGAHLVHLQHNPDADEWLAIAGDGRAWLSDFLEAEWNQTVTNRLRRSLLSERVVSAWSPWSAWGGSLVAVTIRGKVFTTAPVEGRETPDWLEVTNAPALSSRGSSSSRRPSPLRSGPLRAVAGPPNSGDESADDPRMVFVGRGGVIAETVPQGWPTPSANERVVQSYFQTTQKDPDLTRQPTNLPPVFEWRLRDSGVTNNLVTVTWTHRDDLWAGGERVLLRSQDAGETWERLPGVHAVYPAPWYWLACGMLSAAVAGLVSRFAESTQLVTNEAPGGVTDNPIQSAGEDALGFLPMVQGLARFFRNRDTKPPLIVAINGEWGSGKSSLMRLIQAELRRAEVPTVWFNAWHHQQEESLFVPLLRHIMERGVPSWWKPRGWVFRARLLWVRFKAQPIPEPRTLVALAVVGGLLWWLTTSDSAYANQFRKDIGRQWAHLTRPESKPDPKPAPKPWTASAFLDSGTNLPAAGTNLPALLSGRLRVELLPPAPPASAEDSPGQGAGGGDDTGDMIAKVLAAVLGGGGLLELLNALLKKLRGFSVSPEKLLPGKGGSPEASRDTRTSYQLRFAKEFKEVTLAIGAEQMVLFIDDLDRCHQAKVLEVLEAVNFLVCSGSCFVVLGIAREQVESALSRALEEMAKEIRFTEEELAGGTSPALAYARRYLRKLVNMELQVPTASRDQFLQMILRRHHEQKSTSPGATKGGGWKQWFTRRTALWAGLLLGLACCVSPLLAVEPGATNPPAQQALLPQAIASDPPAVSSQGLMPFVLLGGVLVALAVWLASLRTLEPVVKDPPSFAVALDLHFDDIARCYASPRELKRFLNVTRYLTMRWFAERPGEDSSAAGREVHANDVAPRVVYLTVSEAVQKRLRPQKPEGAGDPASMQRAAIAARHLEKFGAVPDVAEEQLYRKLIGEVRFF
jgi:hypothetical protein